MIASEFFVGQQVAFRAHAMDGHGKGIYGEVTQVVGRMARIVLTNREWYVDDPIYLMADMDNDGHFFDVKGQEHV